MNFAKFLRTPFLQNTSGRLLLLYNYFSFVLNVFCRLHWQPNSQKWVFRIVGSSIWKGVKHEQKSFLITQVPCEFVRKKFCKISFKVYWLPRPELIVSKRQTTWSMLLSQKEAPTQTFSCEIYEIYKTTFFAKHVRWLLRKVISQVSTRFENIF